MTHAPTLRLPAWPGPARAADAAVVAGQLTLVVGTFLPWLASGSTRRNSYATGGVLHRLLDVDGAAGKALSAWPFVGLACAVAIAATVLGRPGLAVGPALAAALCAGVISVVVLSVDTGSSFVRAAGLGPVVTLCGAVLTVAAVILRVIFVRAAVRTQRTTGRNTT